MKIINKKQTSFARNLSFKLFICIILTSVLFSCTKMAMKMVTNIYKKPDVNYITNGEKTVAYISMVHLNKKDFFDNTKKGVDSLRDNGYTIFYESARMDAETDKFVQDTIYRKVRKLMGIHLTAYDDTNNKSIQKYQLEGLISQTNENTGINPDIDVRADIPLDSIINIYEKDKGEILLSKCDYKTPLNDKYKCSKLDKGNRDYFMLTIRNRVIADKIISSTQNKIAIVYGLLHYKGVLEELQKNNADWHQIEDNKK